MRDVIVVGGGASGLAAAIEAARGGCAVTLLEQKERTGKKILATGNGRCNLTNRRMDPEACYRGETPGFAAQVLGRVTVEETLDWFGDLGIPVRDRDGYVYPRSLQASSVAEALALEAEHLGVSLLCGCRVTAIREEDGGFAVETEDGGVWRARKVILAAGSKAVPSTGSDGSGYELARSLGHRIVKPLPALVQLVCRGKIFKQLAGIRAEAKIVLFAGGRPVGEDRGELQLTDYGISGIPVFQVSRFASVALDRGEAVEAVLDFLPDWSGEETEEFLADRRRRLDYRPGEKFLSGLLPEKLGRVLMSAAGISLTDPAGQIPERKLSRLAGQLKGFRVEVTGTRSFDSAQICCGGVSAGEIDPASMESRLHPGLHLTGELVDVDGICGGYNLQWAWSTGILAGRSAAAAERRVGH